jgi:hypothetical protein
VALGHVGRHLAADPEEDWVYDALRERERLYGLIAGLQAILTDLGEFEGPLDGRLTEPTIAALDRFCRSTGASDCGSLAIPPSTLAELLRVAVAAPPA